MTNSAPILYVEDEEDYQILVTRILERAGLTVRVAETGAEGRKMLQEIRPSLLILDINLPDTNGYAICEELRHDPAWVDLPILMLTVRRRPDEWLRGFSSGANDYISKPINPPELVERVVTCLQGKAHPYTGEGTPEYNLIQAAVAGNRAAYEVLVQQYKERLTANLQQSIRAPHLIEDLVSQAFFKAFQKLSEFRGEASFYTWVYRIAMNESSHILRRTPALSLDELTHEDESVLPRTFSDSQSMEDKSADQEMRDAAREILAQVPEPYRQALDLYFVQELAYDEIAARLEVPMGTVMSRLHKGRKLLKETWDKQEMRRKAFQNGGLPT